MKTISRGHYALSFCAAAIMFAGCGGVTQFPNPVAQTSLGGDGTGFRVASPGFATPRRVGPNSSGTEALTGKAKIIKPCGAIRGKGGKRHGSSTSFSAHGNATGPYPGTFTASGSWAGYPERTGKVQWVFGETFTITSSPSTISGSIHAFGLYSPPFSCTAAQDFPASYMSGSVSGYAFINIIQKRDFSESLDGL
jgi:hypothetical protein